MRNNKDPPVFSRVQSGHYWTVERGVYLFEQFDVSGVRYVDRIIDHNKIRAAACEPSTDMAGKKPAPRIRLEIGDFSMIGSDSGSERFLIPRALHNPSNLARNKLRERLAEGEHHD